MRVKPDQSSPSPTPSWTWRTLEVGAHWRHILWQSEGRMKTPTPAPHLSEAAGAISSLPREKLVEIMSAPLDDFGHHHWDKLRHKTPPTGLTTMQWWFLIRSTRQRKARPVALHQKDGQPFSYVLTDEILEACEDVTQRASGEIKLPEHVVGFHSRDEYVYRSLFEEAITSSQLEGASTSRRSNRWDAERFPRLGPPRSLGQ